MNFDSTTRAEDVLEALPPGDEDDRWENKGADFLVPSSGESVDDKLAKQVSAFANSGGGFLVIGVSKSRILESCPAYQGKTSLKDWLATKVESCVDPPIRDFKVHVCPFREDGNSRIYVVQIGDSAAAPHQVKNKGDRRYYYRLDGHSVPAPHFHIELLRSRFTKAVLAVKSVWVRSPEVAFRDSLMYLKLELAVEVENVSFQATSQWGVRIKAESEDHRWRAGPPFQQQGVNQTPIVDGRCFHGREPVLLPSEATTLFLPVQAKDQHSTYPLTSAATSFLASMRLAIRPLSQNHVGETYHFHPGDDANLMREIESYVRRTIGDR